MNDNMAIKAVQLTFKFFLLIFKSLWYVLNFGFRTYKQNQKKKEKELQVENREATATTLLSN